MFHRAREFGVLVACVGWSIACGGGQVPEGSASTTAPPTPPPPGADFDYLVRLDAELTELDVTVCARGRIDRLVASRSGAEEHVLRAEVRPRRGPPRPLERDGRVLRPDEVEPGDCLGYVVDLREAAEHARWGRVDEGAVLLPSTQWLWRPVPREESSTGTLRFELPEGTRAAVPFAREGDHHRLDESAFRFLAHTAFGRFEIEHLQVGRADIRVARLPGALSVSDEGVRQYIRSGAEAVATLNGRLPFERAQILVVPVGPGRDDVAFGHVGRGGGGSVMLFVRENAELESMKRDWILVHELSHLALPYVRRADAWLSEGLATYYQEVLRARGGLRTPLESWRALHSGLASGRRDGGSARSLREESANMRQTFAFRRVYWGGAAFALELDVALRRQGSSLDALLARLEDCCTEQYEPWSAQRLISELDRLSGSSLPSEIAARHLAAEQIPALTDLYDFLGLRVVDDGGLQLDGSAPGADIRRAITEAPR